MRTKFLYAGQRKNLVFVEQRLFLTLFAIDNHVVLDNKRVYVVIDGFAQTAIASIHFYNEVRSDGIFYGINPMKFFV